jgi:hypothetical protein
MARRSVSSKSEDKKSRQKSSEAADLHDDPRMEAARKRLHDSLDPADTIEAIREIVTNLLGCEEIGLFAVNDKGRDLLWSFGIDPDRHPNLESFSECALPRVLGGELHIVRAGGEAHAKVDCAPLRAFIPIHLDGRTAAVLVMLKLLPQKAGFDEADIRLVKLLSEEAGKPLFARRATASA